MHALRTSNLFVHVALGRVLGVPSRRLLPLGWRCCPEPDLLGVPRWHLQPGRGIVDKYLVPLLPRWHSQPRAPIDCGLGLQSMPSRVACCATRHAHLRPLPDRQVHVDVGQHRLPAVHSRLSVRRGLVRAPALPGRYPRQPDRAHSHRLPWLPERVRRVPGRHIVLCGLGRGGAVCSGHVQQPVAAGDVPEVCTGLLPNAGWSNVVQPVHAGLLLRRGRRHPCAVPWR